MLRNPNNPHDEDADRDFLHMFEPLDDEQALHEAAPQAPVEDIEGDPDLILTPPTHNLDELLGLLRLQNTNDCDMSCFTPLTLHGAVSASPPGAATPSTSLASSARSRSGPQASSR